MSEKIRYTTQKPARLLYASICTPSAPRLENGQAAAEKYNGTFGLEKVDFDAIVQIMVSAIQKELGSFSGNPSDYYLACMSGAVAAKRVRETAEFKSRGKPADEAFKMKEKAEERANLFQEYTGVLMASSKFPVDLARLDAGKIVGIAQEQHLLAEAEKKYFYRGALVAPSIDFSAFRRKTLDAKDGVTAYLKECLFVKGGTRLGGSGADPSETFKGYAGYSDLDPTQMTPHSGDNEPAF